MAKGVHDGQGHGWNVSGTRLSLSDGPKQEDTELLRTNDLASQSVASIEKGSGEGRTAWALKPEPALPPPTKSQGALITTGVIVRGQGEVGLGRRRRDRKAKLMDGEGWPSDELVSEPGGNFPPKTGPRCA
jgi:hypothetical protein